MYILLRAPSATITSSRDDVSQAQWKEMYALMRNEDSLRGRRKNVKRLVRKGLTRLCRVAGTARDNGVIWSR